MKKTMKIEEFMNEERDIDVYDDVVDGIGIAFCGPMLLTPEGKKEWEDVLNLDITVIDSPYTGDVAIVEVDKYGDDWEKYQIRAKSFFYALAGYCAAEDYDKWFIEG